LRISRPQTGQAQLGACTTSRAGRCAGNARRADFGSCGDDGCSSVVPASACAAVASDAAGGVSVSSSLAHGDAALKKKPRI